MNKRAEMGGLLKIAYISIIFSLVSTVYIFIAVFMYGAGNDYLFYNLQNMTEDLENQGIIKSGYSAITQEYGDSFHDFNFHFDDLWLIAYILFVGSTFIVAYKERELNHFGFLTVLFYGIMVYLFFITIFAGLADWLKTEILLKIIPSVIILLPKFYFYLDHIGIFSAVHLVICLFLNKINFDFNKIFQRKKQDKRMVEDNEII